jgi:hypothetical protein
MREVELPRLLHELHGERTTVLNILLVYSTGILVAGIFVIGLPPAGLPLWKLLLSGFLALDIGGGVVANLSASTNLYYRERKGLRIPFILIHAIHPALFALLFPAQARYFACVFAYTAMSCLLVNRIRSPESQQIVAASLVAVGVSASFLLFDLDPRVLYLVAPLFMTKLILGFSVRRG